MRLTHIKLAGFKSFVDPATLALSSNLTAVVGPNGCGKSNVIDAVRWVTGESNARQLRGEALEDVIFNGSSARKPVGRASVELKFDNSDGKLAGEWGSYAEISVRRELTRDGASKYTINNTRARRRDVVDLFLGTGLGGRSNYAVIEQGAVNRLIEARPEDMRQVLEEAAGISKYKERRRETENRIRHTRDNLDRLDDLIGELSERLTTLKRQAESAERYKTLKADERRLKTELLALKWRAEARAVETTQAALDAVETELRAAISARRAAVGKRESIGQAQQTAGEAVQNAQAAFYDAQATVGRIEQAMAYARRLAEQADRQRQASVEQREAAEASLAGDNTRAATLADELAADDADLARAREVFEQAKADRKTAEASADSAERAWDELSGQATNPAQQLEAERTRERYNRAEADKLAARHAQRVEERQAQGDENANDLAERDAALAAQREAQRRDQAERAHAGEREQAQIETADAAEAELADTRRRLSEAEAEYAGACRLQQALLREDDASLANWFAGQALGEPAGLARRIRIQPGYETAARNALARWLSAFETLDFAQAAEADEWPGERLTLAVSEPAPDGAPLEPPAPGLVSLATCVDGPAVVMRAARAVFVAENAAAARRAQSALTADQCIVTPLGVMLGPDWLTTPAAESADATGIFERQQHIDQLAETITTLGEALEARQQHAEAARQSVAPLSDAREALDRQIAERTRAIETADAELEGMRLRAEEAHRRKSELDEEIADLETRQRALADTQAEIDRTLTELSAAAERFESERSQARARLGQTRRERDRARHAAGEARRRIEDIEARRARRVTEREALEQRMADTRATLERLGAEIEAAETNAAQHHEADYSDADLSAAQHAQATAEQALREARETAHRHEGELKQAREAELAADQALDAVRERQNEARLAVEAATTRRSGIVEQLREVDAAPAPIVAELPDDATTEDWQAQVEATQRRISRLGAINLAAIDEHEQAAERERYLSGQRADLAEALDMLEAAIARIDRETRQRFKQTFEAINERFSSLFPSLFGGGEAELSLTEQDWLTTGVRVMARPPGKQNASIQMLSGGEKTLTAVALLFALFELNPAPFCMLDEIDAPLDDANVQRFCDLVAAMSDKVQFIVITHNKLTMALAEQLHGVTMAEPGVSRLVSVDIESALELAG